MLPALHVQNSAQFASLGIRFFFFYVLVCKGIELLGLDMQEWQKAYLRNGN